MQVPCRNLFKEDIINQVPHQMGKFLWDHNSMILMLNNFSRTKDFQIA